MKRTFVLSMALLAIVAAAMVLAGSVSTTEAGPCICPKIYAPVICSNGKTYPNQCVADCHHAKDCVPTGGGI